MPRFASISAAALNGNGGSSSQPQLEDLSSFTLDDAFEWGSNVRLVPEAPSFNVLYVETQGVPVLSALSGVVKETVQFLEPLGRFGIPQSSLADKCPYFIPDRAQRHAAAIADSHDSHHHPAPAAANAHHEGGHGHHRHRMHLASHHILSVCKYTESGEIFHHPKHHSPHPHFLIGEVDPWSILLLNLGFLAAVHRLGAGRWRV